MKFTSNDAERMISYLSFIHYVVVFALEKWLFSKNTFFDHYCTLAVSLYSSNDFRIVTHKFVPGLLVLLHHKCICLSIKHLTIFRTCIIVLVFIHHSQGRTQKFCKRWGSIFQKTTRPNCS